MNLRSKPHPIALALLLLTASPFVASAHDHSAQAAGPGGADTEIAYLAENAAAMDRMMADMDVDPSGDVDRDFVAMMTPHHQGAIDMAVAVLKYGHNEKLKRLAQEIIVEQQQEIAAMKLAIGDPLPPSLPTPTQTSRTDGSMHPAAETR